MAETFEAVGNLSWTLAFLDIQRSGVNRYQYDYSKVCTIIKQFIPDSICTKYKMYRRYGKNSLTHLKVYEQKTFFRSKNEQW